MVNRMNKGKSRAIIWLLLFLAGFVLMIVDSDGHLNGVLLFTCLVFVFEIIYTAWNFQSRIFFFCFLLAFFTFLLGGEVLDRYFGVFAATFTPEINRHTDICLMLSLMGLFMGYVVAERYGKRFRIVTPFSKKETKVDYDGIYCRTVRKISKYIFFITYAVWILVLWRQIRYVLQHGYMTYYLHYSSGLPEIVHNIADITPAAYYVFLATMPSKKEIRLPLVLYLLRCVLSLGTGRRLYFMVGLLLVFAYLVARNKYHSKGEVWFSRKMGVGLLITVPFLLAGMYLFEYIRADIYVGTASQYNPLFGFFARQGISVNVIKYAERFKDTLNQNAVYSFYNTSKFLQTNVLNRYFLHLNFGYSSGGQTVQNALESNSLANYISYRVSSASYLDGVGMGSCYIAELFVDFGYIGVVLGNFIYGYIIQTLYERGMNKQSIWSFAVGLYVADLLFRANRSTFDAFFAEPLYVTFWGTLLIIHIIAKNRAKQANATLSHAAGSRNPER